MIELDTTPEETTAEPIAAPKKTETNKAGMIDAIQSHEYIFFSDPGHSWLEVPYEFIRYMNIGATISKYSYFHAGKVYLEEDCDAGRYMEAFQRITGTSFVKSANYRSVHQEETPIRSYARFK